MKKEHASAFRQLWRAGMAAAISTRFPGHRFVIRDLLRNGFRQNNCSFYSKEKVENTVKFLEMAANRKSVEHLILKNRLHIQMFRRKAGQRLAHYSTAKERPYFLSAYDTYEWCLQRVGTIYNLYL